MLVMGWKSLVYSYVVGLIFYSLHFVYMINYSCEGVHALMHTGVGLSCMYQDLGKGKISSAIVGYEGCAQYGLDSCSSTTLQEYIEVKGMFWSKYDHDGHKYMDLLDTDKIIGEKHGFFDISSRLCFIRQTKLGIEYLSGISFGGMHIYMLWEYAEGVSDYISSVNMYTGYIGYMLNMNLFCESCVLAGAIHGFLCVDPSACWCWCMKSDHRYGYMAVHRAYGLQAYGSVVWYSDHVNTPHYGISIEMVILCAQNKQTDYNKEDLANWITKEMFLVNFGRYCLNIYCIIGRDIVY